MLLTDLPIVNRIQTECYLPGLVEDEKVYREKLRSYPKGCFVLEENDKIVGYAISHPWILNVAPKLNDSEELPKNPTVFHIHDVAVTTLSRGKGFARRLVGRLRERAREMGFNTMTLVSVQDSKAFWETLGFTAAFPKKSLKSANYPEGSVYMKRTFSYQ